MIHYINVSLARLGILYECWTIGYQKKTFKPYRGFWAFGFTMFELRGLSDSYVISVKKDVRSSQAHLALTYKSEKCRWLYSPKLAYRMQTLPRKVQNVMSELLRHEDRRWSAVVLSKSQSMEIAGQTVKQYHLILRSQAKSVGS